LQTREAAESIPFLENERIGTAEMPGTAFGPQGEITTVLDDISPGLPSTTVIGLEVVSHQGNQCP
jgi:hypothetical protein